MKLDHDGTTRKTTAGQRNHQQFGHYKGSIWKELPSCSKSSFSIVAITNQDRVKWTRTKDRLNRNIQD